MECRLSYLLPNIETGKTHKHTRVMKLLMLQLKSLDTNAPRKQYNGPFAVQKKVYYISYTSVCSIVLTVYSIAQT